MKYPNTSELPDELYTAVDCRDIDQRVINCGQVSGYELMTRAGQFAFDCLVEKFPAVGQLIILCGKGNNGGDGYVMAGLASQFNYKVRVYALGEPNTTDAILARKFAETQGCEIIECLDKLDLSEQLKLTDLIVDALLGTGVDREIKGYLAKLVDWVNKSRSPVLACDVPTGLNSDTGCVMGHCVKAAMTTTFIALKAGLFTADGKEFSGEIRFSDLEVGSDAYQGNQSVALLINKIGLKKIMCPRSEIAHKGTTGYLAIIGGASGMMGAVLMAGKAAYRAGCGRVKILTNSQHAFQLPVFCPELLTMTCDDQIDLISELNQFQALAIGPGLGQSKWGRELYHQIMQSNLPMVVDADALNLLACDNDKRYNWILTPHPGEAARLLNCSVADIQNNRFEAANQIVNQYGGVCVLKGSGTLIAEQGKTTRVCTTGNAGQATAGMGDVLTGLIAGLKVQGYNNFDAACLGVWMHGSAADCISAEKGKIGMMASDLFPYLQTLHNELVV